MYDRINRHYLRYPLSSRHIFALSLVLVLLLAGILRAEYAIESPYGHVFITFDVKNAENRPGCLTYTVTYDKHPIVADSPLGLAIEGAEPLETGFEIVETSKSNHSNTYSPVYGERKTIRDHYNQLEVTVKENS